MLIRKILRREVASAPCSAFFRTSLSLGQRHLVSETSFDIVSFNILLLSSLASNSYPDLKRRYATHSLAYTQPSVPVKNDDKVRIGCDDVSILHPTLCSIDFTWSKDVSQSPTKVSRPNAPQKRIAVTGVWPLFVVPNVFFIHLLPYS